MSARLIYAVAGLALLMTVCAGIGAYAGVRTLADDNSRQDEVAARGAVVMPFDLEKTTHVFTRTEAGGIETVTANDPADAAQVALIRAHLEKESHLFAGGDFSDPVAIHGADMPGVAELAAAKDRLMVEYRELPDGASLVYSSTDNSIVEAIHVWFDAQTSDHGRHASQ